MQHEKNLVCSSLFFRHGDTKYTEVYPDLLPEGERKIRKSTAQVVRGFVGANRHRTYLKSSPKPRAHASTFIIAEELSLEDEVIVFEPLLSSMVYRDADEAQKIFSYLLAQGAYIEREVLINPLFKNKYIFEQFDELHERTFKYLTQLLNECRDEEEKFGGTFIHGTHFEIITPLVKMFFQRHISELAESPVLFGESVMLNFFTSESESSVRVEAEFRKQKSSTLFTV